MIRTEKPPNKLMETVTADNSGQEQTISAMMEEFHGFNDNNSRIMDVAQKAGVDIEENDLQKLGELSEEATSAKKEFFGKIFVTEMNHQKQVLPLNSQINPQ